jgi:hypothetical protein
MSAVAPIDPQQNDRGLRTDQRINLSQRPPEASQEMYFRVKSR